MKKYELYDLTAREILADNLTFAEVPELFGAYAEFYPDHEIIAVERGVKIVKVDVKVLNADEVYRNNFKAEWFTLMDELCNLGNVY